jgi:hypothetical protein
MNVAVAFMAYEAFQKKADYLRRGRLLATVDTDALKGRWVASYREWIQDPMAPHDHRGRLDIEAELDLRGEEIPAELVLDDTRKLEAAIQERLQQVERDPALKAELDRKFQRDYAEFVKGVQNPH